MGAVGARTDQAVVAVRTDDTRADQTGAIGLSEETGTEAAGTDTTRAFVTDAMRTIASASTRIDCGRFWLTTDSVGY